MVLEKVITLASAETELMFRAMERSLRATGCGLPLWVIPYNQNRFTLPANSLWFENTTVFDWVESKCAHPMMRKYLSFTESAYQYVDTDVIFLRNPEEVLRDHSGFVACCTDWNKPQWTVTTQTRALFAGRWTTWQKEIFCAGQYACDKVLYSAHELMAFAERGENREACMDFRLHDQPGANLFVLASGVPRLNLTLPPYNMESTMAGDYPGEFQSHWKECQRKPLLIHFAGRALHLDRPINRLFMDHLTAEEQVEWNAYVDSQNVRHALLHRWPVPVRILNALVKLIDSRFHVQPRS